MTRFTASNQSQATLKSSRKDVWAALTDPKLLPKLTPYLQRIDAAAEAFTLLPVPSKKKAIFNGSLHVWVGQRLASLASMLSVICSKSGLSEEA